MTLTDSPTLNSARTLGRSSECVRSRRSTSAWVSGTGSLEEPTKPVTPGVSLTTQSASGVMSMLTRT